MPETSNVPPMDAAERDGHAGATLSLFWRAMRPAQWLKNGVVLAGLVFGARLLDETAVLRAAIAVVCFCLLSSGFYLVNDVRDMAADRLHPVKRLRPVASGELPAARALGLGFVLIAAAISLSAYLGRGFFWIALAYAGLMAAYNAGLKQIVIVDVLVIAMGFVIRAAAGAIAVEVSISHWLLICTLLLALLIGFGKRRHELVSLEQAALHRRNLEVYSTTMLDQCVGIAATGTLIAYVMYAIDANSSPSGHRMMLTIPLVAYGIFRYIHLLYQRGQGGAPEAMPFADRSLLLALAFWSLASALILYAT